MFGEHNSKSHTSVLVNHDAHGIVALEAENDTKRAEQPNASNVTVLPIIRRSFDIIILSTSGTSAIVGAALCSPRGGISLLVRLDNVKGSLLSIVCGLLSIVRGLLSIVRGLLGVVRGLLGVVRGLLGVVRGLLGVVRGLLDVGLLGNAHNCLGLANGPALFAAPQRDTQLFIRVP
jgi:hypothetical protein